MHARGEQIKSRRGCKTEILVIFLSFSSACSSCSVAITWWYFCPIFTRCESWSYRFWLHKLLHCPQTVMLFLLMTVKKWSSQWKQFMQLLQASLSNCINCFHCDDHFFTVISFPQFIYDLFHISLTLVSISTLLILLVRALVTRCFLCFISLNVQYSPLISEHLLSAVTLLLNGNLTRCIVLVVFYFLSFGTRWSGRNT